MTYKDVRRYAAQIDRHVANHGLGEIGTRWRRFDQNVILKHRDGTRLGLCHAYAVWVRDGGVLIVTEHHGKFVYPADEVLGLRMTSRDGPGMTMKVPRLRLVR
jgi:hypothetical protein